MKPYVPDSLPIKTLDYEQLFGLVGNANAELARYDGLLQGIPNPVVMLSPLTTQEAVLSSKIEGTQATVDEVLEQEAGLIKEGEKYKDIQEISNYRKALFQASDHVESYPIRLGLIREMHKILLSSVRGKNKTPGEFRTEEMHRDKYYQKLRGISERRDWNSWIAFFLKAVTQQAKENSRRAKEIMALYDNMKIKVQEVTHSQYSVYLLDTIFNKPVFRVKDTSKQLSEFLHLHEKTVTSLLKQLKEAGILVELQAAGGRRSATLCFPELINLAEGKSVL
ncbi:MAG: Fic/DOC family N-terminal domain-containing protein [Desulfobacteraceae bacterium]